MNTHPHTRSDYPQIYSPRIFKPPRHSRSLLCDEYTERRIRTLLTWHAGSCGLINDEAVGRIARMVFSDELTIGDLRALTTPGVFVAVVSYMTDCMDRVKEVSK